MSRHRTATAAVRRLLGPAKAAINAAVCIAGLLPIALCGAAHAQALWKNVRISAGSGFVTDIVAQPKVPGLFYLRTDVGGFYRWDAEARKWIPMVDFLPVQDRNDYGGESIAVDPNRVNTVAIACGMYLKGEFGVGPGAIFESSDRGRTWTRLGLHGVFMGSNHSMRWGGERLAIAPGNSRIILFGSRTQGLWRTVDGGRRWNLAPLPFPKTGTSGVQCVAFDPVAPGTVYAGVADRGVFASHDYGARWSRVSAKIVHPERMVVAQNGVVWVTHGDGVATYFHGRWADRTPSGYRSDVYCALAIDPGDARDAIVSYGIWAHPNTNAVFRTQDGGVSWTKLAMTVDSDVPWYRAMAPGPKPGSIRKFLYTPISNFLFDPNNTRSVWFTGAGGIFHTANIDRPGGAIFDHEENGHEELCVTALACPPSGHELIAGVMDVDGFVFDRGLSHYPSRTFVEIGGSGGATEAIAYEESDPKNMARVLVEGGGLWNSPTKVATSTDGGFVWRIDGSFPTAAAGGKPLAPLAVAQSATDPADIVVGTIDTGTGDADWWARTAAGWVRCSGLPRDTAAPVQGVRPIAADRKVGDEFYLYDGGRIYRSTDGGRNFSLRSAGAVGSPAQADFFKLVCRPGTHGDLWLSEDNDDPDYLSPTRPAWEGLYHSRDGGRTWTKVATVSRAITFSFGVAPPGKPSILSLYGRLGASMVDGISQSDDLGKTWINIQHPGQAIGDGPWTMAGSRQTVGRVFIGTIGRGIYYTDTGPAPAARRR